MRVLLTGGGSGGSAAPVIAVGQALQALRADAEILYIGTRSGPEEHLVRDAGLAFVGVPAGRFHRYWTIKNLGTPFLVVGGLATAQLWVRRFRPDVAFGAGGFGTLAPLVAARLYGAKIMIHQQDVAAGLANRLLAPLAAEVTVALPGTRLGFARASRVVGNPVRAGFLNGDAASARRSFGLPAARPVLLVTGGGTGALRLNQIVAQAAAELSQLCSVVHLTGVGKRVSVSPTGAYQQIEFVASGMGDLVAAADVLVSRAGMSALTEIAALRKASILVPMPASHQEENAAVVARHGGAQVIPETELSAPGLVEAVRGLLGDADRRRALGDAMAGLLRSDAADTIARRLIALAGARLP